jgi:hypothetical protein
LQKHVAGAAAALGAVNASTANATTTVCTPLGIATGAKPKKKSNNVTQRFMQSFFREHQT